MNRNMAALLTLNVLQRSLMMCLGPFTVVVFTAWRYRQYNFLLLRNDSSPGCNIMVPKTARLWVSVGKIGLLCNYDLITRRTFS